MDSRRLKHASEQEAIQLTLSPDQLAGRETRQVYSIDPSHAITLEDAFSITDEGEGRRTLHISTPDVGTFVHLGSAMQRYAYGQFLYSKTPQIFSQGVRQKFGLSTEEERPALTIHIPVTDYAHLHDATFSRELVQVRQAATPREVKAMMAQGESGNAFIDLYTLTGAALPATSTANLAGALAKTAQRATAEYMRTHGIPGIFRLIAPSSDRPEQSVWSLSSRSHGSFSDVRASFTSPIRQYPDYLNQLYLVAHLEGHRPPLSRGSLGAIMRRLVELKTPPPPPSAATVERQLYSAQQNFKQDNNATYTQLREALALALFSPMNDSDQAIRRVRKTAAHITADHRTQISVIINIAKGKAWIRMLTDPDSGKQTLVTHDQRAFPYPTTGGKLTLRQARWELIREITGLQS